MLDPKRIAAALLALLISAGLAGSLLVRHHGLAAADALCSVGETSGCDVVNQSPWSKLAGVSLAAVGLAFSVSLAILLALSLMAPDAAAPLGRLALGLLAVALLGDVWLAFVQYYYIGQWCTLCLGTYAMNALAFAALWPARRAALAPLSAGGGRVALAGWMLASLVAAGGALGVDAAFASATSSQSLLGQVSAQAAPAASGSGSQPATPPVAAGSVAAATGDAASLAAARAEIDRLHQILDDPQKLEVYFQEKSMREFESARPVALDVSSPLVKGPKDAPIHVVEFSDFLCPFCRSLAGGFNGFLPQSAGRVAIHFKNFPLDTSCNGSIKSTVHPGACELAKGAVCAAAQGRFSEYHDRVFQTEFRRQPTSANLPELAPALGLDASAFSACLASPATLERVKADIAEAVKAGVQATPTVFINGRRAPRINEFVQMVDAELGRLGLPPLPKPPAERAR
ncbi:MAG: thioredoxin domain-containing protein [Vicinamibacteria bacterium]